MNQTAFRESDAARAQLLQRELRAPLRGLPQELPEHSRVVVAMLRDAEAPLLKQQGDPLRQLLAAVFRPDALRIVVPVVDEAFSLDHLDGLPDDLRALARQQLVEANDQACILSLSSSSGTATCASFSTGLMRPVRSCKRLRRTLA